MGKIVTHGKADGEYEAGIMTIHVRLCKKGNDTKELLGNIQKQCEEFLGELDKINIPPENVIVEDNGLRQSYDSEKLEAEKSIIIKTKIDVPLCTYLFSVIKEMGNSVRYDISYDLQDEETVVEELLQKAVEDSRRQAEIIAKALGKKIVGPLGVNEDFCHRPMAKSACLMDNTAEIPEAFVSGTPLSDRAALPRIARSEEIVVSWELGD